MSHVEVKLPLSEELSEENFASIEKLASDLKSAGINVAIDDSAQSLIFTYDTDALKRNAGRKRKDIPDESILSRISPKQMDDWLLTSSIEAIENELGVGRATAFRRRAEARSRISYAIVSFEDEASPSSET